MRKAEKERKKNLDPNSVHTRPGQENSEKNRIKILKNTKPLSGIIFSQNGMRQTEKDKKEKKLVPNSVHTVPEQENSQKNSKN